MRAKPRAQAQGHFAWQCGHHSDVRPEIRPRLSRVPQRGHEGSGSLRTRVSHRGNPGMRPWRTAVARVRFMAACRRCNSSSLRSAIGFEGCTLARQQISSVSMLPSPAITDWSIKAGFTAPRCPRSAALNDRRFIERASGPWSPITLDDFVVVRCQPYSAKLPEVGVPELAPVERDDESFLALVFCAARREVGMARHPAVYEEGRAVCRKDQPFAVPARLGELVSGQLSAHGCSACVAEDPGVKHVNVADSTSRQCLFEFPAEPLDVGQFRHESSPVAASVASESGHGARYRTTGRRVRPPAWVRLG